MSKLLASLFLLVSSVAVAQRFEPFKLNVSAGFASPVNRTDPRGTKSAGSGGVVYSIEPQYNYNKHIDIGLRVEQALIQRPEILENSISYTTQAKSILSALLTVNYSVGKSAGFRPYIGVGGGFYHGAKSSQQETGAGNIMLSYPLPATNKWGGVARGGVQIYQFNVEFAYNLLENTTVQNETTGAILRGNNRYFSIKAGYTFGANRHQKS